MAISIGRRLVIAAIIVAAALGITYVASPVDIADLKLVSVDAQRLGDIPQLAGQGTPDTPVFKVRFSTRNDLVALANRLDAYTIGNRVLVGDAGCNPALQVFSYTSVAEMLVDFAGVYDEAGGVQERPLWAGSSAAGPDGHVYHLYFGVNPAQMAEFASAGIQEAPICFMLAGDSRTGRPLTSNIVTLPPRLLGQAAARLVGFMGRNSP